MYYNTSMNSSWSELSVAEKAGIDKKIKNGNKEESLTKLDEAFWQAIKNEEYQKADKCAKIFLYIKIKTKDDYG